jgi:Lysozyme like domain
VIQYGGDPGGFGNAYPGLALEAPYRGFHQIYYGHTSPIGKVGKHVSQGEPIGSTMGPTSGGDAAGLPNWLEIGFWPPSWANGPAMHDFLMHGGGGGPGSQRGGSWTVGGMSRLWQSVGGQPRGRIPGAIGMAESGGRAWIVQSGQPPGLTGYGLWQITPTSGIWQHGAFGDLLNPTNNARAAVSLYRRAGGFSPWVTYTDGAYRQFMDGGGWLSPGPNMVLNQTRRGEAVLTPGQSRAFISLSDAAEKFGRGGGHMGGGMMRDVYLTLPEGSTVAEALREISWLLRTSSQQGYTGVR